MKPTIHGTHFGTIAIEGETYPHDVVIRLDGRIEKRKKKLSKRVYGTSHLVSLDEARHMWDEGATLLVVGSGQYGALGLSPEASTFFEQSACQVEVAHTSDAIEVFNAAPEGVIGLFHVTC
ncbi:MAG: hypothetical protein JRI25_10575 [Deltaproteobacteria bacterium]|nr:hypothetical protein [Deltaproteobacteria bacterium]MBW2255028.1 hypothetical protein [Deltaproteobacteria bacterium]